MHRGTVAFKAICAHRAPQPAAAALEQAADIVYAACPDWLVIQLFVLHVAEHWLSCLKMPQAAKQSSNLFSLCMVACPTHELHWTC